METQWCRFWRKIVVVSNKMCVFLFM